MSKADLPGIHAGRPGPIIRLILRVIWPASTALLIASLLVMMFEALSRLIFAESYFWAEETVLYLLVWSTFLAMPAAGYYGYHLRTDLLVKSVPGRFKRVFNLIASGAGILFSLFLTYSSSQQLIHYFQTGMLTQSNLDLPMWLIYAVLPLGAVLLLCYYLRCLMIAWRGADPFEAADRFGIEEDPS